MKANTRIQTLTAAEAFISGFEDDSNQVGVTALLRDIRGELSSAKGHEEFTLIEQHGQNLFSCPLCDGRAEMWERVGLGNAAKAVMCSNGDAIGPLDRGCPLYMPPEDFYRATYREAASTWNTAWKAFFAARTGHA